METLYRTRAIGSTGQRQTPGNVFKGKKMPGHLGSVKRTVTKSKSSVRLILNVIYY